MNIKLTIGIISIFISLLGFSFEGKGTKNDPYLIRTQADLEAIGDGSGNYDYYKLINDIVIKPERISSKLGSELLGYTSCVIGKTRFHGFFDGGGYKIKNLVINGRSSKFSYQNRYNRFLGLFAKTTEGTVVKDLSIENAVVNGIYDDKEFSEVFSVGILTGSNHGCIHNCNVEGIVNVISESINLSNTGVESLNVGGLIGENLSSISFNSFLGEVCVTDEGKSKNVFVGGLAGVSSNEEISSCYTNGLLEVNGALSHSVGGLVGQGIIDPSYKTQPFVIHECYSATEIGIIEGGGSGITHPLTCGEGTTFVNCFYDSSLYQKNSFLQKGIEPLLTESFTNILNFSDKDWFMDSVWKMGSINGCIRPVLRRLVQADGGDGSVEHPYLISTVTQLKSINCDLNADYKLIRDIDFGEEVFQKPVIAYASYKSHRGHSFSGTLDGNGYKIRNFCLNYNRSGVRTSLGLFGTLVLATVKNLELELGLTGSIQVGRSTNYFCKIGALAGTASASKIISCNSSLNIYSYGKHIIIGGLIGNSSSSSTLDKCHVEVDISVLDAEDSCIGGVVGSAGGVLKECVFSGSINAAGDFYTTIGGISGRAYANLIDCEANIDIFSSTLGETVGGIVGSGNPQIYSCKTQGEIELEGNKSESGGIAGFINNNNQIHSIEDCRSSISITALNGYAVGGIVGYIYGDRGSSVKNCNYKGSIKSGKVHDGAVGGVAGFCNGDISLSRAEVDITVDNEAEAYSVGGLVGEAYGYAFEGNSSDGNITIRSTGDDSVAAGGLIGSYKYSEVFESNSSCDIYLDGGDVIVGGLIGFGAQWYSHAPFSVSDSYATGSIDASHTLDSTCGGLAGCIDGTVSNCYFKGDLKSTGTTGGLSGCAVNIYNSFFEGYIEVQSATYTYVGGVVGWKDGEAVNCYANGTITVDAESDSDISIGGFAGHDSSGKWKSENCYSNVDVSLYGLGKYCFGGFIGGIDSYAQPYDVLINSYSNINLNDFSQNKDSFFGGFIGNRNGSGVVSNCFYNSSIALDNAVVKGEVQGIRGLSELEMADITVFMNAGWKFGNTELEPWVYSSMGSPHLFFQKIIPDSVLFAESGSLEELKTILESLGITNVFDENLVFYQEILSNSSGTFQHDVTVIQKMIDLANEGVTSCSITLNPGWNMVSCPFLDWSPAGNDIDCQLFKFYDGRYENVPAEADLIPGCGYWLFYPESEPKNIVMSGSKSTHATINISSGWNLFGPVHNEGTKAEKDVSEYSWLYSEPFYWQGHNYSSISEAESSKLKLGEGYWGFVKDSNFYVKQYWLTKVAFQEGGKFVIDCFLCDYCDGLKVYIWDKTDNKELLEWSYFSYNKLERNVVGTLSNSISVGHEYSMQIIPVNGELGGKQKNYNFTLSDYTSRIYLEIDSGLDLITCEFSNNNFSLDGIKYDSLPSGSTLEWSAASLSFSGEILETATGFAAVNDSTLSVSDVFDINLGGCKIVFSIRIKTLGLLSDWKTFRFEQ